MPTPRMPSQAQMRAQMRAAERNLNSEMRSAARKAERDIEREMKTAQRKAQAQLDRDLKKWERDTNRKLQAARPKVTYTTTERRYLAPIEEQSARQAVEHPERRDVFLCHAWGDREGAAAELHDLLESYGVSVWFSEKDVALGTNLIREIDRGLKMSRIGLVLVTPAMLVSLAGQGIADKELSALLATDRVIPVVHGTTFDALRDESPLLASRSGLNTDETSLTEVAVKVANAVRPEAA